MSTIRTLLTLVLSVTTAMAVSAQTAPAPATSGPMVGATMSHDCAKPMAKHDHGAERNSPRSVAKADCMADGAVAAPAASASAPKKQLKHDHAKFHKNS